MIIFIIYLAVFMLNIANIPYETYDPVKIKKNRNDDYKPPVYNTRYIIFLITILTIFCILYDYCIYNFDIDLQKEYEAYNEKDLMFGKMNICQYAMQKYIIDVLLFKYGSLSLFIYIILIILTVLLLYYNGLIDNIGIRLYNIFKDTFNVNRLLTDGYMINLNKLYKCRKPLMNNTLDYIYYSIF